ncbi:UNVERIFIED_CONTAM: hypothetical protein K2H54_038297 [Gekko kuhli]
MAKITTRLKGPMWGRFSMDMQETWSMTPTPKKGSQYESYGGMGTLQGMMGTETQREGEPPEYFLDTHLGKLEQGYDWLMQMIENTLANIPWLVGDAIQLELWVRLVAVPVVPQAVPGGGQPGTPLAGKSPSAAMKPKKPSHPKEGLQDQRIEQGLCLKCGEARNFAAIYLSGSMGKKGPEMDSDLKGLISQIYRILLELDEDRSFTFQLKWQQDCNKQPNEIRWYKIWTS